MEKIEGEHLLVSLKVHTFFFEALQQNKFQIILNDWNNFESFENEKVLKKKLEEKGEKSAIKLCSNSFVALETNYMLRIGARDNIRLHESVKCGKIRTNRVNRSKCSVLCVRSQMRSWQSKRN